MICGRHTLTRTFVSLFWFTAPCASQDFILKIPKFNLTKKNLKNRYGCTIEPRNQTVIDNQNATFTACLPDPGYSVISWIFNTTTLNDTSDKFVFESNPPHDPTTCRLTTTLTIVNASYDDTGPYWLEVTYFNTNTKRVAFPFFLTVTEGGKSCVIFCSDRLNICGKWAFWSNVDCWVLHFQSGR